MNQEDKDTKTRKIIDGHVDRVFQWMSCFSSEIMKRAGIHDASKYSPEEFSSYSKAIDEFEKYKFGTEGYNKAKTSIDEAVKHHYKHNKHHPEYFNEGIDGMDLADIIEMLCDWKSATQNHPENPGNIFTSLNIAIDKYKISPQLAKILYNTIQNFKMER